MPLFLLSMHKQRIFSNFINTSTAMYLYFPKNLTLWWDSNPGLLVPEADAMSTAPRRQDKKSFSTQFHPNIYPPIKVKISSKI
jgi:hypothetical protein